MIWIDKKNGLACGHKFILVVAFNEFSKTALITTMVSEIFFTEFVTARNEIFYVISQVFDVR